MSNPVWPKGFMINPRPESLDPELLAAYRKVPSAHASDCLGRLTGGLGLRAYHNDIGLTMCGMALTVRIRPGDNLMIHKAMLMAQPGDIIVVDGAGDLTQAVMGGLMRTTALTRRIGGLVINGAIRDVAEWAEGELPVYALGHVHRGPSKTGPGEVNVPVACAGMAVTPGDLIIGDADGVVSVPRDALSDLLPLVKAHAEHEDKIRQVNREKGGDEVRFAELLRSLGCPV
ncbi:methyltransferase [Marinobacterium aestuarii]|uniref:Putative 4-hydroxy-4-methyl-2-oxoglutarate aldolase n=1 Tax=Marinobacterium aestuarii TaxID=1821621 RepID=A0A1A9F2N3_9GAMM|nr:RraA family protein [Marinobacterium aestuarii]ANG64457.1 methyltransferase [Marinobacterium aestuarii]